MKGYRHTLNLPKTQFPMKGNLSAREPEIIQRWKDMSLHQAQIKQNKKPFVLIDGPPYANGDLHMGHVLNKVLKDIVIKYKNMTGFSAEFVPSWDCHGLPIEHIVTKKIKQDEKSDANIRSLCRDEANKWVKIQSEQFARFGVLASWNKPCLTLDKEYEACQIRILADLVEKGLIYRGEKAVYWCYALQTSLAEAEIEYFEHKSPSIYVKFPVVNSSSSFKYDNLHIMIWTTTPWTIPANRAHAVDKDFDYSVYKLDNDHVIMADGLKDHFEKTTNLSIKKISSSFKGSKLCDLKTSHIMYPEKESPVVLGDHVTLETGTGIVHTAPGHGQEDFELGKKYDLEIFSPVDEFGKYTDQVPDYKGMHVFEANNLLIERFKQSKHLVFSETIKHSYPHCWRSKTPIIFRTTPQWFFKMDHDKLNVRKLALEQINKVSWLPKWGLNRIGSMIEARPDWCISRQRIWGVPIPVFYCAKCKKAHADKKTMLKIADLIQNGNGIEEYWSNDIDTLIKKTISCCGAHNFIKGKDILDVWFDSGIAWAYANYQKRPFPADIYLEGSDQHRGWFHTSLLTSIAKQKVAPFKQVITHGFVMFSKGVKMSKSRGNVVDPKKIIQKDGAEILRLWASHEDYTQDIHCSPESFDRLKETYRRIRNTMRFMLGNLDEFDYKNPISYNKLHMLEQWILHRLNNIIKTTKEHYENHEFFKIYHLLNNFFSVDLSSLYLDIVKDRLYTSKKTGHLRKSTQTALFYLTYNLTRLMAPILSFLAEEVYTFLPNKTKKSIFLTNMPDTKDEWDNPKLASRYETIFEIRDQAKKKLEELRESKQIGSSLEAQLILSQPKEIYDVLNSYKDDLRELFIVSELKLNLGESSIIAKKAAGKKCARCWNFSITVNSSKELPDICSKCIDALK